MAEQTRQPRAEEGLSLSPLPDFTVRGPAHRLATLRQAWDAVRHGLAQKLGLVLPEPVWVESAECAVYRRQVRLARIQPEHHSVEDLTGALVRKAAHLLSLADTCRILDQLSQRAPIYGKEMERLQIPAIIIHGVLRLLLRERVSIQDLEMIMSTIIEQWKPGSTPEGLLERVREPFSDWLCQEYGGAAQELAAVTLAPNLEKVLTASLLETADGQFLDIHPDAGNRFLEHLEDRLAPFSEVERLVLLCGPPIRLALFRFLDRGLPDLPVLSWNEVTGDYDVRTVAVIDFKF